MVLAHTRGVQVVVAELLCGQSKAQDCGNKVQIRREVWQTGGRPSESPLFPLQWLPLHMQDEVAC